MLTRIVNSVKRSQTILTLNVLTKVQAKGRTDNVEKLKLGRGDWMAYISKYSFIML